MNNDYCRTKFITTFKCAECGNELTMNADKCKISGDGLSRVADMYINHCSRCYAENLEPLKALKRAMLLIDKKEVK